MAEQAVENIHITPGERDMAMVHASVYAGDTVSDGLKYRQQYEDGDLLGDYREVFDKVEFWGAVEHMPPTHRKAAIESEMATVLLAFKDSGLLREDAKEFLFRAVTYAYWEACGDGWLTASERAALREERKFTPPDDSLLEDEEEDLTDEERQEAVDKFASYLTPRDKKE